MIAVLTYDAPHRKTQDILFKLKGLGYKDVTIIASPWVNRKNYKPIFRHRPDQAMNISLNHLSDNLGYNLKKFEVSAFKSFLDGRNFSHIIIGGTGILPQELVLNHKIVNSHPAYLPYSKGLDALKWAIYNGDPVGVTTHYIDDKADEGLLIDQKIVPLYYEDTFHSFAFRQYEYEIQLLVESIEKVKELKEFKSLVDHRYTSNRRMSHHLEMKMMQKFEERRKKANSWTEN
jgi:phosphoribosylglycinamide formyltransferase-1